MAMLEQDSANLEDLSPEDIQDIMLHKAQELFQVCDKEQKGFINKIDMQRLQSELSLTPEQLETVFDSLDEDQNGFLTLKEFSEGFGSFLGMRSFTNTQDEDSIEKVYEEAEHSDHGGEYQEMIETTGIKGLFEDESSVKFLWQHLRTSNQQGVLEKFETLLANVAGDAKRSQMEFFNLEAALKNKSFTYDNEVKKLYEEMEHQIKQEKDNILAQERAKERTLREQMQQELLEKDRHCQELLLKHQELEERLSHLNIAENDAKLTNEILIKEKDQLEEMLNRSQESLEESKHYINQLRQQQRSEKRERAKVALRLTEGIAIERESLVKQLDFLKDVNRKLRDDKDESEARRVRLPSLNEELLTFQIPIPEDAKEKENVKKKPNGQKRLEKQGSIMSDYFSSEEHRLSQRQVDGSLMEEIGEVDEYKPEPEHDLEYLNNLSDNEDDSETNHNCQYIVNIQGRNFALSKDINNYDLNRLEEMKRNQEINQDDHYNSSSSNDDNEEILQRDGRNTHKNQHIIKNQHQDDDLIKTEITEPERLFKVVFVGDSGVGKTSFIHRFCHNHFKTTFSATIGIDFQVRSIEIEGHLFALQLWDTAGQERFRSITKQYFRKADGVVLMYDVTSDLSVINLRNWMSNVRDSVDELTVLLIIGNKTDLSDDDKRVMKTTTASRLANENAALFYETSAKDGKSVNEAMLAMVRLLKEKEDNEIEKALKLGTNEGVKKKCCR